MSNKDPAPLFYMQLMVYGKIFLVWPSEGKVKKMKDFWETFRASARWRENMLILNQKEEDKVWKSLQKQERWGGGWGGRGGGDRKWRNKAKISRE